MLESSKALTKAADALDADRIVSVRPRRYILKEALSYVGQLRWYILQKGNGRKTLVTHLQLLTIVFYCWKKERKKETTQRRRSLRQKQTHAANNEHRKCHKTKA